MGAANRRQWLSRAFFTALQQGVVDGRKNPSRLSPGPKFWEVQGHVFRLTGPSISPVAVLGIAHPDRRPDRRAEVLVLRGGPRASAVAPRRSEPPGGMQAWVCCVRTDGSESPIIDKAPLRSALASLRTRSIQTSMARLVERIKATSSKPAAPGARSRAGIFFSYTLLGHVHEDFFCVCEDFTTGVALRRVAFTFLVHRGSGCACFSGVTCDSGAIDVGPRSYTVAMIWSGLGVGPLAVQTRRHDSLIGDPDALPPRIGLWVLLLASTAR